jgi:hypothetical protein
MISHNTPELGFPYQLAADGLSIHANSSHWVTNQNIGEMGDLITISESYKSFSGLFSIEAGSFESTLPTAAGLSGLSASLQSKYRTAGLEFAHVPGGQMPYKEWIGMILGKRTFPLANEIYIHDTIGHGLGAAAMHIELFDFYEALYVDAGSPKVRDDKDGYLKCIATNVDFSTETQDLLIQNPIAVVYAGTRSTLLTSSDLSVPTKKRLLAISKEHGIIKKPFLAKARIGKIGKQINAAAVRFDQDMSRLV